MGIQRLDVPRFGLEECHISFRGCSFSDLKVLICNLFASAASFYACKARAFGYVLPPQTRSGSSLEEGSNTYEAAEDTLCRGLGAAIWTCKIAVSSRRLCLYLPNRISECDGSQSIQGSGVLEGSWKTSWQILDYMTTTW